MGEKGSGEISNSKLHPFQAKNQTLEAKLENLKLLAENRALKEETHLNKLKAENKAIRARMEAAEQKANKVNGENNNFKKH
jgi:outer membrane murein-binding lipoprotein Lpp